MTINAADADSQVLGNFVLHTHADSPMLAVSDCVDRRCIDPRVC
jgi:hypothetical protein